MRIRCRRTERSSRHQRDKLSVHLQQHAAKSRNNPSVVLSEQRSADCIDTCLKSGYGSDKPWGTGYENQDWFIPSPALQVDELDLKLSPDQIRETLNYFLLCSDRVSQMSKTYDDIEAVSRLLEEKEKDLELTARIGKELLQTNNKLTESVTALETDLKSANEKITQLSHEIFKKTELIQVLTNDMDESTIGHYTGDINLDLMQKRISCLEDENKTLKNEFFKLVRDTDEVEAHEADLLKDITGQLACSRSSMMLLEDELDRTREECRLQHEEILTLKSKLVESEVMGGKYAAEIEELCVKLQITEENQNSLAVELSEYKLRYYELEGLLRDTQEQLRKLRKKQMPVARSSMFPSLGGHTQGVYDSLQSELEMSLHSELSTDSGISNNDQVPQYKKVFETVRCASQSSLNSADSMGSLASSGLGGYVSSSGLSTTGPRMSVRPQSGYADMRRSSGSIYSSSSLGYPSIDSTSQSDSESSLNTDSEDGYPAPPQKGIPGVPGAADLEAALKRLTPSEVLARRANLQHGPTYGGYEGESYVPFGCRTPDSLMSTGSMAYQQWRLPEKLQIVKPMEGSQTLHHWSQLAQPTFGGLLEERPGVKIKGGKELEDMGLETYGLSDLEEDEEYSNPGKMFDSSAPIYTLTNSTVMHPDDGTIMTPSNVGSRVASVCSSVQNSPPQTPRMLSRRNSCSTFSTTYGLAKMLNERGIKAVTPSAVNTPCGVNSFTPTATPCNSPLGSPDRSRSNSPEPNIFSIPQMILSSMPEFVQQTIGGGARKKIPREPRISKRQKSGSSSDKGQLIGRIERMGISNLMSSSPGALSLSAGMYHRPALTSPMAQLTCLLPSHSTENLASKTTGATSKRREKSVIPEEPMGIPGKPGTDSLKKRLEQLNARKQRRQQGGGGQTRPDLGTVANKKPVAAEPSSSLGTLSSMLFGRKGGLF
ncbi:PREDICTED: trafficking kinesin-binding protein milt isoform X2 [Nicrophorus vespilloides]|uniref:Trafficking kinesin-binding protein milt isoform X2 n=1 Tax=Nicrophorus vespilloides TaxID=110193 RepID=A0ABM1MB35_NICVS|nr:PREDICTED: trafficking kinesin-binding protein milt isoform X2 [Nicrophorus vespilloides]